MSEAADVDAATTTPTPEAEQATAPETELEKGLRKAREDPDDFNQWVVVEKLIDKDTGIEQIREVYNGLLSAFPLCYGYWKKFAEAEHKHGSAELAVSVFDRGIAAVPYSVDLWNHYATFQQKVDASADTIRKIFEEADKYIGTDYLAHSFWDKYIKFETEQNSPDKVAQLHLRALKCPLRDIDHFFTSLEALAGKHQLSELLPPEEIKELKAQCLQAKEARKAAAVIEQNAVPEESAGTQDQPMSNGVLTEPQSEDVVMETEVSAKQEPAKNDSEGEKLPDQGLSADDLVISDEEAKQQWILNARNVYEETKGELERRKPFENQIKRPYFHVKPLPEAQQQAWSEYIDYIVTTNEPAKIVRLFERCLVACANYPEFWIRYVRYLESQASPNAKPALLRAVQVFCKKDATLHLFAAKFEERQGDIEAARASYQKVVTTLAPGLVEAIIQAASFERRQSNNEAARSYFDSALEREDKSMGGESQPMVAMVYADFLWLDCRDSTAAREVYEKALQRWPAKRYLLEGAIHFEEHCLEEGRTERVIALYSQAVAKPVEGSPTSERLPEEDQELLSQRLVEFADRFASPQQRELLAVQHEARFGKDKKAKLSGKRPADEAVDNPAAKRAAIDNLPTQGMDPSASGAMLGQHGAALPYQAQHYASQPPAAYTDPHSAAQYYPAGPQAVNYAQYYQYPPQQGYGYQYPGY